MLRSVLGVWILILPSGKWSSPRVRKSVQLDRKVRLDPGVVTTVESACANSLLISQGNVSIVLCAEARYLLSRRFLACRVVLWVPWVRLVLGSLWGPASLGNPWRPGSRGRPSHRWIPWLQDSRAEERPVPVNLRSHIRFDGIDSVWLSSCVALCLKERFCQKCVARLDRLACEPEF